MKNLKGSCQNLTLKERFARWLYKLLEGQIIDNLQIGGHCGCCGKWVPDVILPKIWAITLCERCSNRSSIKQKVLKI